MYGNQQQNPWGQRQPGPPPGYGHPGMQPHWAGGPTPGVPGPWHGQAPSPEAVNKFVTRVFGWMGMGLGLTAMVAWFFASQAQELVIQVMTHPVLRWVVMLAPLGLVLALQGMIERLSVATATAMFLIYAAVLGFSLSTIFFIYTAGSIAGTFLATAMTFGFMFVLGWTTKRDLTSMGSILIMAVWGLFVASIINIFLASSALYWVITYVGVLVFVGLTAYDAQKIKEIAMSGENPDSTNMQKMAIIGALHLYLDFINLFLMLLRILGARRE